ncbi:MAG: isoleucine--tRNA ligase [Corallococcus sp.]|nr:isoleucine--tRNA ligase [Corallococcus sp.]MCM1360016.1 isoleucine--tRNA ligase [Corallococcus sp.]MCM1395573.1 isoleucine--tRNA ligase [Corallococcus sp.]
MSKYKKVDSSLNFVDREKEVLKFWRENKIFEQTAAKGSGCFTFYDGPPTANGKPHIGHVLTRSIKDLIPRYQVMKGKKVLRKAGWDTHGLPVELEVEKLLGIDGKKQIEEYGIEPFIEKCKESVWKYKGEWEQLSDRVAYWADMEHPYVTYDNDYIESEWWALKQIHEKGLLYKGFKIVPYCPRCGTALSSHEVAQGYKDVKEKSAVAKFQLVDKPDTYFLAWTTTPWTLPSNVALCMNADFDYATVEHEGARYILANELVSKHFEEGTYSVSEIHKGAYYEGMHYKPLFDYAHPKEDCYFVTNDDYVTLTDGTGIVHIAPAFGEDDANVGRRYNLPLVQLVGEDGKFVAGCSDLTGVFCKAADKQILRDLKQRGLLFSELMYEHSYPHCWRCDTPLIYYARKSWFVKMTDPAVKEKLLAANASVNWIPPTIGSGRMGNFLENVIDWGISRDRYWGTPLPVWVCDKCGKVHVIGSRKELADKCGCSENIELHRPFIDGCKWKCECGGEYVRTPEVIDCWFDSGSMPYAQFHYPFENKDLFEQYFPADFISEAVDQTRGWFYVLLAVSTLLFGKAPFKNCIVLGLVGDEHGVKMSKHKGNVVDPWDSFNKQGADAVRWYFYTSSSPWLPSRFYDDAVSETQRRFLGTLWNTYAFYVLYADIDDFDPSKYDLKKCKLTLMDKWILSEVNQLVKTVDEGLSRYEITETARAVEKFTDMLSNWYVRRSRERYWGSEWTADKQAAYMTLYTVLDTLVKVAAPFVPFITESIYQNITANFFADAPKSVHLCSYPKADEKRINKRLNSAMEKVLDIVVLGRSARNAANIKNRQPLSKMYVATKGDFDEEMTEIVKNELNVKEVVMVEDAGGFADYEVKPQMRTLGPKYGKLLIKIREHLANLGAKAREVVDAVKNGGKHSFDIDGEEVVVEEQDLLVSSRNKDGYSVVSDCGDTVALDVTLTDDLIEEGIVREIVSKIQTMRKECNFVVTDHIIVGYDADERLAKIFANNVAEIAGGTLANAVVAAKDGAFAKEWDLNGEIFTLYLTKA